MPSKEVSSRFPFISLEKALKRAQEVFEGDRSGKPMAVATAFQLWGYSAKSSGGFQTVGALKMYGLLEDEGSNEDRRVRLTDQARRYFLDERDDVRAAMLESFALAPPLFNALWSLDRWSEGMPADPVARSHLKIDRGLNDQSARSLLSIFKENMRFASLRAVVQAQPSIEPDSDEPIDKPLGEPKGSQEIGQPIDKQPAKRDEVRQEVATQTKPINFDMETVSGTYRFDNADDLSAFIEKLEKIKTLMPSKQQA